MRPHAAIACALLRATAALEAVPADAFRSVARGRVAVIDDFLARDVVAALRGDAEELWDAGLYSAPTRDTKLKRKNERFVLRGSVWRDFGIGRGAARNKVAATRLRAAPRPTPKSRHTLPLKTKRSFLRLSFVSRVGAEYKPASHSSSASPRSAATTSRARKLSTTATLPRATL